MHQTIFYKEIMDNCIEFDAVAIGEADYSFPKLLKYYLGEETLENLDSVALRVNGQIVTKEKLSYIEDLDSLPRPGYEFLNIDDYTANTESFYNPHNIVIGNKTFPISTSRSCPNQCNFCSMNLVMGKRFRPRSAKKVVDEIKYLYDAFGIRYFQIMDDNFSFIRERVVEFCTLIKEYNIRAYFETNNGIMARTLDRELLTMMKEAGFILLPISIESASDHIRNTILHKNISKEKIYEIFSICNELGILVNGMFIFGFLEEDENSVKEMKEMLEGLHAHSFSVACVVPFPGTKLFEQCLKENLFVNKTDTENLWTGEGEGFALSLAGKFNKNFVIKPYALTLSQMDTMYDDLVRTALFKTKEWNAVLLEKFLKEHGELNEQIA
jgi:radical SAM superfamily enzyme YgiQ (UPF0313 family)